LSRYGGTLHFLWLSSSALTSESLALEKRINILFELSGSRVTDENDLSLSVNEQHMRDTLDAVIFVSGAAWCSDVVMLNRSPFLVFDVVLHNCSIFIYRKTDQTHFITPIFASFLKHLAVVGHGSLARGTPSCPEVK